MPRLFGAFMLVVGAIIFLISARYLWRTTAVRRATELDGTAAPPVGTLVRVTGSVERLEDSLVAPFSGADCVVLRYEIEERRLNVVNLFPWFVSIHVGTGIVPFGIRTAFGTYRIGDRVQSVVLRHETVERTASDADPSERVRSFEREHGSVSTTSFWRDPPSPLEPIFRRVPFGARRYREGRASAGDEVTVVGRRTEDGIDPLVVSDRSTMRTILRMGRTTFAGFGIATVALLLGAVLLVLG